MAAKKSTEFFFNEDNLDVTLSEVYTSETTDDGYTSEIGESYIGE